MKITVITLFPKMISAFIEDSILKRAQEKGEVEIEILNLRDFGEGEYKSVDDRPYGGGAGMILKVAPLYNALKKIGADVSATTKDRNQKIVLTSPKGRLYNQKVAIEYSKLAHLVIIAGHYEEVDERVRDFVDEDISLGDFVMTGGEITAAAIIDSLVRLIPNVLKKEEATQFESFFDVELTTLLKLFPEDKKLLTLESAGVKKVQLLEYPQYTRPEDFHGKKVPEILLSGHHKQIEEWKIKEAFKITVEKRPDLLK